MSPFAISSFLPRIFRHTASFAALILLAALGLLPARAAAQCPLNQTDPSVTICAPANGATLTSPVNVVAGTHSSKPVSAIWVYLDTNSTPSAKFSGVTSINTNITVPLGTHKITVKAWNSAGTLFQASVTVNVVSGSQPCAPNSVNPSVTICTPANGATVSSPVHIVAETTSTTYPTTAMWIYVDNVVQYKTSANSLDTSLTMAVGTHSVNVQAWNSSGQVFKQVITITVGGGGSGPIPINHIIVMMQENRSFDHYFSNLNNYRAAQGYSTGVDVASPTATQPQDSGNLISRFHMRTMCIEELSPNWLESHGDVNRWDPSTNTNILMDGFVHTAQGFATWAGLTDTAGYRSMGYYTEADLPYYYFMATQFATSDRWFSPAPTNSTVNRLYGFAATSAGHAHDESYTLSNKTIFQALQDNGHTWKIYYTDTDNTGTPASRIWRFQPFASNNTSKIVPIAQYFTDVQNGTLPDFAFIETGFLSGRDEHPGGTVSGNPNSGNQVQRGAAYVAGIVNALMTSPSWKDSAFILTWDEMGGLYDHVPPDMNVPNPDGIPPDDLYSGDPTGDFTRTGFRVPLIVVSPWTKPHYVSHTSMDYTAYLKLVETRFGLSPLTGRDAAMPDMTEFFDFVNKPWATPPTPPAQPTSGECNYTDMP